MTENQLIDWIQLINSENIGPVTFYKMLKKFSTAQECLKQLKSGTIFPRKKAEQELIQAQRLKINIIARGDANYPKTLEHLHDAPPLLYVRGQIDLLNYPAIIAIVGSRNTSINGRKIASKIAYDLTDNDVLVISGMARGIDTSAHKGALYAKGQTGATIAVLGTGVDMPYPTENTDLYEQICVQGSVVSEYPLGTSPQPNNFPRRNRIISALSSGILVVEASVNSGSLITARLGLEQGKDIFAVPASPIDGRSAGTNRLIRNGAILTENADDILETLKFTHNQQIKDYIKDDLFIPPLDKPQKNEDIRTHDNNVSVAPLLSLIPIEGIEADDIIRKNGNNVTDTMMHITELELEGKIERRGSRLFVKK